MPNQHSRTDPLERFWTHVEKTPTCWLWTNGHTREGYPQFWDGKRNVLGTRWIYRQLVGPIPDGLHLDHVRARGCTSTMCVNPAHLEPVTPRENVLRGDGHPAVNARKTQCTRGHTLEGDNLFVTRKGFRKCITCWKAWKRTPKIRAREAERSRRRRAALVSA